MYFFSSSVCNGGFAQHCTGLNGITEKENVENFKVDNVQRKLKTRRQSQNSETPKFGKRLNSTHSESSNASGRTTKTFGTNCLSSNPAPVDNDVQVTYRRYVTVDLKGFKCRFCDYKTTLETMLERHIVTEHGENVPINETEEDVSVVKEPNKSGKIKNEEQDHNSDLVPAESDDHTTEENVVDSLNIVEPNVDSPNIVERNVDEPSVVERNDDEPSVVSKTVDVQLVSQFVPVVVPLKKLVSPHKPSVESS